MYDIPSGGRVRVVGRHVVLSSLARQVHSPFMVMGVALPTEDRTTPSSQMQGDESRVAKGVGMDDPDGNKSVRTGRRRDNEDDNQDLRHHTEYECDLGRRLLEHHSQGNILDRDVI